MEDTSKPSIGLLLALALAVDDEEEADKIIRTYLRREIPLVKAISLLRELPCQATII